MTLANKTSRSVLTLRVFRAGSLIGALVNIKTARNPFQRFPVTNSFISVPTATNIATNRVSAVQLSLTRYPILRALIDIYAFRFDP